MPGEGEHGQHGDDGAQMRDAVELGGGVDQNPDAARCPAAVGGAGGLAPGKHGDPCAKRGGSLGGSTADVAGADDHDVGGLYPVAHAEQYSPPARGLPR